MTNQKIGEKGVGLNQKAKLSEFGVKGQHGGQIPEARNKGIKRKVMEGGEGKMKGNKEV